MTVQPRVVIIGAGFAGVSAVRELADSPVAITLIDKNNYHVFRPLLYQVATAGLSAEDIAFPVRSVFRQQKNLDFLLSEVVAVDFEKKTVLTDGAGAVDYDYLIVANGSVTNYYGNSEMNIHSFGMKDLEDGVKIRDHLLRMFEKAAHEPDPAIRRMLLTFVVVGAGPTGVETAGALAELVYQALAKEYRQIDFSEPRIILYGATDSLLTTMPEELRQEAYAKLTGKNVVVKLATQIESYDGSWLRTADGDAVSTRTVIWAAGVRAAELADRLGVPLDNLHRVKVNEYLQVPGFPEACVIGDTAHYEQDGAPLPMVAPVAMQQGKAAADNILRTLRGEAPRAFVYHSPGSFAIIGRNAAVGTLGRSSIKGFTAWLIWAVIHIWRLTSFRNRLVVFVKWVWSYITYDYAEQIIQGK
ncbi:MAG: NAD(P)/FAD-dependent oxidoreductase [Negativicutes bacterium]|nr:NAD(P)/FAD-dependent oxidoreductase [Negativicutes bacterium]